MKVKYRMQIDWTIFYSYHPPDPCCCRVLMPLIEECVRRNISTLLTSTKSRKEEQEEPVKQEAVRPSVRLGPGVRRTCGGSPQLAGELEACLGEWGEEQGRLGRDIFSRARPTTLADYTESELVIFF